MGLLSNIWAAIKPVAKEIAIQKTVDVVASKLDVAPSITEKQRALVQYIDLKCRNDKPVTTGVQVDVVKVPMIYQGRDMSVITAGIDAQLKDLPYAPGSVAFMVDWDGTWVFLVGYRADPISDEATLLMWSDLASKTRQM